METGERPNEGDALLYIPCLAHLGLAIAGHQLIEDGVGPPRTSRRAPGGHLLSGLA